MISDLIALVKADETLFPSVFKTVGAAMDVNPIKDLEYETPAIFFFAGGDRGGRAITHNPVNQEIVRNVCAWIVGPVEDMSDLVDALRPLVITYKAGPDFPRLTLQEGKPFDIHGDMWWLETYKTEFNQR